MNKFKPGEFAVLQGQVVEILEVQIGKSKYWDDDFFYKIKLLNDNLTHRVHQSKLSKMENQTAPKVLFSNK